MRIIATAALILLMLELTQAEPRQSKERNHYRNGLMFEKDHVVGVARH
jgi:hypothetical protein